MLAKVFLTSFIILFLTICSGCSTPPQKFHTQTASIPFQRVEIGLCEDYPKNARSLQSARRDLKLLRTNHIHVLRIAFPWDSIETERGKYDWSFWDDFVRMATDEFGIRLIPYVCYTPQWASTGTPTNFWRCPPKDNVVFAEFVKTIVARYRNRIHSWEIWNEPDNPEYWEGSLDQFASLLQTGSAAARETDPSAKIVLGGIAWNLEFLRSLFQKHHARDEVDVVNLHCYYETWSSDAMEDVFEHVLRANQIIRDSGSHQAIWLAEIGYSDFRRDGFVSAAYRARFPFEHTPMFQAQTLGRAFSSALATGCVQLIAWYRIHDLPPGVRVIGDENNRRLGVLDKRGRPKPVLRSLDYFNELFSGKFRCLDSVTAVTRLIQSDVQAHIFQKRDGDEFVISWLRTVSLLPRSMENEGHTEKIEVRLYENCSKMIVHDEFGRRLGIVHLEKGNDGEALLPLSPRRDELDVFDCER